MVKARTILGNRAYVQNFLAKLGLNEKDTKGIIDFCKGLSFNDCYLIVDEHFDGKFSENNLYDIGLAMCFPISLLQDRVVSKKLRCVHHWKSGTEGFANSGNEPYCEYYAYQVAETMGIDAVQYGLSKWKGRLAI